MALLLALACALPLPAAVRYEVLAPPASPAAAALPQGKRVPAGWPAFAVGAEPVRLRVLPAKSAEGPIWLRLTTAIDLRAARVIEVALPGEGGRPLGQLDLRFAHALETFQLSLAAADASAVRTHGLTLRLAGGGAPLWFFAAAPTGSSLPVEFQPHLMSAAPPFAPLEEFHTRFASLASLQPFGWMEGCVLDGLADLSVRWPRGSAAAARTAHWRIFAPGDARLVYENPRSEPADDRLTGIESLLPFADLARHDPTHPLVEKFVTFVRSHTRTDGAIQDGSMLSAEGSYTVAYPLAVIAAARRDHALAALAHTQLRLRGERLWHDGVLWLRRTDADQRTFRGWARGIAWHALGVARSIEPLRTFGDTPSVDAELRRLAALVLPLQRPDGLWSCFVEDGAAGLPDTSGSAGIAAALARGARLGVLGLPASAAAQRTLAGAQTYLTPDGLLNGAAQSNRGGEALQRSDYRVLSQMGMGLFAQLLAESGP